MAHPSRDAWKHTPRHLNALNSRTQRAFASQLGILLCDGFQPVDGGWNVSESVRSRQTARSTRPLVAEMSDIGKWREVSTELVA